MTVQTATGTTTTAYDADGEVKTVTDPDGNRTTFSYNAEGEKIGEQDPAGGTATFAYDADGEMTSQVDALGRTTTYSYNAEGEETGETWISASSGVTDVNTLTYDNDGNQLSAANFNGAYTYTYDDENRVLTVQEPFGLSLTFTHDADGNRTGVQDSLGGAQTSTYDAENDLLTREQTGDRGTLRVDYTYTADNQVATIKRYSDLAGSSLIGETDYAYNAEGEVVSEVSKDSTSTVISSASYSYDADELVTSATVNGTTQTFSYDSTQQLTGDGTTTQSYDANGDRNKTGYVVGTGNQITSDGTWTYSYDAAGQMTGKSKSGEYWNYAYDNASHLTRVEQYLSGSLNLRIDYTYDVYGNRLSRTEYDGSLSVVAVANYAFDGWKTNLDASGNPASFVGQENWDAWADLDATNALTTRRVFGNSVDSLVARVTPPAGGIGATAVAWYLTDRQGTVLGLVSSSVRSATPSPTMASATSSVKLTLR